MVASSPVAATPSAREIRRVLLSHVAPHRSALIVGGLLSLATSATGLALPLVVRSLIGEVGAGQSVDGLIVLLSTLVIANAGIGAIGGYVLAKTGESVVLSARKRLTSHMLRLRLSAVETTEPGDLISRVTGDTTLVQEVATRSMVSAVTGSLTLVATIILMGVVDLVLLGVTLTVLVIAATIIGVIVPRINKAALRARESVGVMGAALERMFGAFRTVKASGAEESEEARLHLAASQAWEAGIRAAKWSTLAGNAAGLAVQGAFIAVLSTGGGRVASGTIEIGTLVAFLLYVFYLMPPIQELVGAVTQYQVGAAAMARIQETETLPIEAVGVSSPRMDAKSDPLSVTFEDVSFRYADDLALVHSQVSFHIPPGGMTAFVGPSGAGKTTVFSLIERFYEPTDGRVMVDGIDVAAWDLDDLRRAVGYVEQDSPVLSGTIRANLEFATPDAHEDDLLDAIEMARLSGVVERMPNGLDTVVGHRGMKLSGGERQRVAIARALLRRPRLLLLDEATSQLDAVNEAALREVLAEAATRSTVLVVAHRLSTVTLADRIVVMDAGQILAIGTHQELVRSSPLYAELAATQFLSTGS